MWVNLNCRFFVQSHSNLQPIGMNTKPAVMQKAKARCNSIIKSANKSNYPKKFLEHTKTVWRWVTDEVYFGTNLTVFDKFLSTSLSLIRPIKNRFMRTDLSPLRRSVEILTMSPSNSSKRFLSLSLSSVVHFVLLFFFGFISVNLWNVFWCVGKS